MANMEWQQIDEVGLPKDPTNRIYYFEDGTIKKLSTVPTEEFLAGDDKIGKAVQWDDDPMVHYSWKTRRIEK